MKNIYILLFVILPLGNVFSQDIIIDLELNEIKSKIIEITESEIKYKKWENLGGPLYNISKNRVYMIIYENGQRDTFNKLTTQSNGKTASGNSSTTNRPSSIPPDNSIQKELPSKKDEVAYSPGRLLVGFDEFISAGGDLEFKVVKNIFNLGLGTYYGFPKEDDILSTLTMFVYGSLYFPLNRNLSYYTKQNKGLFGFAHLGYSATSITVQDYLGNQSSFGSGNFNWRVGADYYIVDGVGLSLFTSGFQKIQAGIIFQLSIY